LPPLTMTTLAPFTVTMKGGLGDTLDVAPGMLTQGGNGARMSKRPCSGAHAAGITQSVRHKPRQYRCRSLPSLLSVSGVPDPGEHRPCVSGCRAGFPHGEGPPMCTANGRPDRPSAPSIRPVGPTSVLRDVDDRARMDGPSRPGHRSHG
jgi:hypothetical protein